MAAGALGFLEDELQALRECGLWRRLEPLASGQGARVELLGGERLINFSSNDYLGLAADPRLAAAAEAALRRWGVGSGAARLVVGDTEEHQALERALAALVGREAALLFGSGWQANVGTIPALVGPGDLIVSDARNHASIIDGARLSRARVVVVPHADPVAVEEALRAPARRRLVVTDALFSMDGDLAPLRALRAICDRHGAILYVDEAHAVGVLGPGGAGACAAAGIEADVTVGTLGKALGCAGAWVAGSAALRAWLLQRCRSFVYTTAPPAAICAAALEAVRIVRADDERRARLQARTARLIDGCRRLDLDVGTPAGPIVPVILGPPERALEASARFRAAGLLVRAIRPPTVPEGTSRLRLALRADHTDEDVDAALAVLEELR